MAHSYTVMLASIPNSPELLEEILQYSTCRESLQRDPVVIQTVCMDVCHLISISFPSNSNSINAFV